MVDSRFRIVSLAEEGGRLFTTSYYVSCLLFGVFSGWFIWLVRIPFERPEACATMQDLWLASYPAGVPSMCFFLFFF